MEEGNKTKMYFSANGMRCRVVPQSTAYLLTWQKAFVVFIPVIRTDTFGLAAAESPSEIALTRLERSWTHHGLKDELLATSWRSTHAAPFKVEIGADGPSVLRLSTLVAVQRSIVGDRSPQQKRKVRRSPVKYYGGLL